MPIFTLLQHKEVDELSNNAKLLPTKMRERIFKRKFTIFVPDDKLPDNYSNNEKFWKNFIIKFLEKRNFKNIDGRYSVYEKTPEKNKIGEEIFYGEVEQGWWTF